MKFTFSWLKQHLQTDADLKTVVATLTKVGLEVEHVQDPAASLKDFVIAKIVEAGPHPNADRLQVCRVDAGTGELLQVVCGAPNARAGLKSVFAKPGTYIPAKKITLGKGVIRGVESAGMLCSAAELELSEEHDGIMELPDDAPVGKSYAQWAALDDPVIDINLTPNRPDAAGVAGIARDLAAAGLGRLITPAVVPVQGKFPCPVSVSLDFAPQDAHLAPAFALRLVRGVRNGPSPEWLQKRLLSIGLRPINALVDITNFLAFDRARPLHVFDAKKIKGNLKVRRARKGESLLALDARSYELDENIVVIVDDKGVESIGGIIGGEASGCDETTTDVLIESALWDPANIARSGRQLGIVSDARYRFERGVDPAFCIPGLDYATKLVLDLCGGMPSGIALAGKIPEDSFALQFPWSEVKRLTELELPTSEMAGILERLGFQLAVVEGNSNLVMMKAPSWRPDIAGKADIVEEIVRIAGLDRIVPQPLPRDETHVAQPVLNLLQKRTRMAKRALAGNGLVEAITWSFLSHDVATLFGGGGEDLALVNPIASDLSDMRPSLLPGLLNAARRNSDRGFGDVALFEVGQIFKSPEPSGQKTAAAAIRRGTARLTGPGRHWATGSGFVDIFDAKADALEVLNTLGIPLANLQIMAAGPAWFHPGRCGSLQFGPKTVIGHFGEIHPQVLDTLDVAGPLVGFELILDDIPPPKSKPTKTKPKLELSDFMPVERDFAFVVDRNVRAADLVKAAQGADKALITEVTVFDVYEGKGIPDGKKSIALSVTLQPREKTLTDAEIDVIAGKIVAEVSNKTGAHLRG